MPISIHPLDALLETFFADGARLTRYRALSLEQITLRFAEELRNLPPHQRSSFTLKDAHEHTRILLRLSTETFFTHSVAIFDNFLGNLTRYAIFYNPSRALGNSPIELRQLISQSAESLLKTALDKKSQEIARQSIPQRIEALKGIIGIDIDIPQKERDLVKRCVRIRNRITHDAKSFEMMRSKDGIVSFETKADLDDEDLNVDLDCFERISVPIFEAIATATFHPISEGSRMALDFLALTPEKKRATN